MHDSLTFPEKTKEPKEPLRSDYQSEPKFNEKKKQYLKYFKTDKLNIMIKGILFVRKKMENEKLKFILLLFLLVFVSGCATSRKDLQLELEFREYLNTLNINYEKNDSIYSNY